MTEEALRRKRARKVQQRENRRELWAARHPGRTKTGSNLATSDYPTYQRDIRARGRAHGRARSEAVRASYRAAWLALVDELVRDARANLGIEPQAGT